MNVQEHVCFSTRSRTFSYTSYTSNSLIVNYLFDLSLLSIRVFILYTISFLILSAVVCCYKVPYLSWRGTQPLFFCSSRLSPQSLVLRHHAISCCSSLSPRLRIPLYISYFEFCRLLIFSFCILLFWSSCLLFFLLPLLEYTHLHSQTYNHSLTSCFL